MDKKIFEFSVSISETDGKIYYDCPTVDVRTPENLLQILKGINTMNREILDMYLELMGIKTGNETHRFSSK